MKQHITPKQAKEITEEQFYSMFCTDQTSFDRIVKRKDWANYHHKKVTIGKCIEILERKFYFVSLRMLRDLTQPNEKICLHLCPDAMNEDHSQIWGSEVIDALWEAVKQAI